jgi:hypothetical protein
MKKLLLILLISALASTSYADVQRRGNLTSPVAGDFTWLGDVIFGASSGAVNAVSIQESDGCIKFESTIADTEEANICVLNLTAGGNARPSIVFSNDDSHDGFISSFDTSTFQFLSSGTANRGITQGHFVDSANGPFFNLTKGRGNATTFTAANASDVLGSLNFQGVVSAAGAVNAITLEATAAEGFSGTAAGGRLTLKTTNLTTWTQAVRQIWDSSARVTFGTAQDAANAIDIHQTTSCITAEGSTANGNESNLCFGDATADGTVTITNAAISTTQAATCADDGAGTAASLTLTPLSHVVALTNLDTHGCTVTLGETGVTSGTMATTIVVISNAGGTVDFADTAGVSELSAAFNAAATDTLTLVYINSAWHEVGRSNN